MSTAALPPRMSTVTVRDARPSDVQPVVALAERGWRAAYDDILGPETIDAAMREWYDPEDLRDSIDDGDRVFYVATEADDQIAGFLRGGFGDDRAHLGAIYADPDRWGKGIGSALLDRFEATCADRGYETIEFAVLSGNDVGRSFYRSRGYEPVEHREVELFGENVEDSVFRGPVE